MKTTSSQNTMPKIKIASGFFAVEATKTLQSGDIQALATFAQAKAIVSAAPSVKAVFAADGAYLIIPKGLVG
jgi:hypothetical protein